MAVTVRLVNPIGGVRREGAYRMAHHRHHRHHRRHNPFASASINKVAVKVGGGLAGGIAAATLPGVIAPSLASGWGGVVSALVVAFGGSWLLNRMSSDFSEGVLIGGTLQAAGRISQIVLRKNLVSFSLSGYGPLQFPLPTPAYQPGGAAPMVPASQAVAKSPKVAQINGGSVPMNKNYSKFAA